jgi:hypothetical protein
MSSLKGRGLFTGQFSEIKMEVLQVACLELDLDFGLLRLKKGRPGWIFVDHKGCAHQLDSKTWQDGGRHTWILAQWGGLRCPEHLMGSLSVVAELLFGADRGARIRIHGPELPILDGSAWPYWEYFVGILQEAFPGFGEPGLLSKTWDLLCFEVKEAGNYVAGDSSYHWMPAEEFSVQMIWSDRGVEQKLNCSTLSDVVEFALAARTFLPWELWEKWGYDVFPGAEEGCAVLWKPSEVHGSQSAPSAEAVLGGPWRHDLECVGHKLLDLLGDLMLGGGLPRAKLIARNPSHRMTLELLHRIESWL